jgi:hypothetical protein
MTPPTPPPAFKGWYRRPRGRWQCLADVLLMLAPRQRAGDPGAYLKSLLAALVVTGRLTDDNRQGVELGTVEFERGTRASTTVTLTDLQEE